LFVIGNNKVVKRSFNKYGNRIKALYKDQSIMNCLNRHKVDQFGREGLGG